jgi:hypothetical protein
MSEAEKQARQEQADRKMQEAATKAYDAASTTPPKPAVPAKKMAKGGSASSRGDGIATKGKTRGTMIAMCGGGMSKGK